MNNPITLNNIIESDDNPYFFSNPNIDKTPSGNPNIYIAQKVKSESHALYVLDVWNNEQYNIGDVDVKLEVDIPFTRYLYNTNDNIKTEEVNGGNKNYSILYYKKNNKINYIALLKYK